MEEHNAILLVDQKKYRTKVNGFDFLNLDHKSLKKLITKQYKD